MLASAVRKGGPLRPLFVRGAASSSIPLHVQKMVVKMAVDTFDPAVSKYTTLPARLKVPPSPDQSKHPSWVNLSSFREAYRKKMLAPDVVEALNNVGFVWDTRQHKWEVTLQGLQTFSDLYGHVRVPTMFVVPEGSEQWPQECWNWKLGYLVDRLRRNKENMSQDRIATLDSLGFIWKLHSHTWHQSMELLATYKRLFGDVNVPQRYVIPSTDEWPSFGHGVRLGMWVQHVRWRAAAFPKARVAALDELGFVWAAFDERWQVNVKAMQTYKALKGHVNVPRKFVTTDEWPEALRGLHLGIFLNNSKRRVDIFDPSRRNDLRALGVEV
ncbi:hypothetical protein AaE_003382 [Aphanomyces astaci]|uniref:Helicase-associated domain-containing protein n=1 Tax=Aphanomyces astaci TaxID=112090 RepID=A0A6A5ARW4_APHAT|nr:hypothetical protein AaE_003382 [Aphanomyces astaci]